MRFLLVYVLCALVFINGLPSIIRLRHVPWSPLWILENAPYGKIAYWTALLAVVVLIVRFSGKGKENSMKNGGA